MSDIPKIVKRAIVDTVTDIGQLSKDEIKKLNKYVKLGYLSKGKGGWFPAIKTVWACPNFDFEKQRSWAIETMHRAELLDKQQWAEYRAGIET
jgi:hypothetical protein